MKKNLFTMSLLALVLSLLLPARVMAQTDGVIIEHEGIWYQLPSYYEDYSFGYAWVLASQGSAYSGDIVIPNTFEYEGKTYQVGSILERAFYGCTGLTSVTIPGMENIGEDAFADCSGLTSVTFDSDYYYDIGDGAFRGCENLTSIQIPGVMRLGSDVFKNCTRLTSITILEGVTSIGNSAFSNCHSLTSITIPASVRSIGDDAFQYCI